MNVVARKRGSEWGFEETKPWFRGRVVWMFVLGGILAVAGAFAAPKAKRAYDRWSAARAVRRAGEFLAKGDVNHAVLDARSVLEKNPYDAEATRIIVKVLEQEGSPAAMQWRERLDSLRPGEAENQIALAKGKLMAGYIGAAAELLGKVNAKDRDNEAYHDVAARVALARKDYAGAESHWEEAARLAPEEEQYRLDVAVLRARHGDAAARGQALDALRELATSGDSSLAARRALLADAIARGDAGLSKEEAGALASAPGAAFRDRLARLAVLRASRDPGSSRMLTELRDGAAAKPDELYQLLSWMNRRGLALLVLDWLPGLPPEITAAPPVCIPVAEARAHGMEWEKLKESVESAKWGAVDFIRLAYHARALDRMDDADGANEAWTGAIAAAGGSAQGLEELARLALGWRWEERGAEALWKLAASGSAPRWALTHLWAGARRRGDTERLLQASRLLMNAEPRSVDARNNFAFLSMLGRGGEGGV